MVILRYYEDSYVESTKGNFSGYVDMKSGNIGGLKLADSALSNTDGETDAIRFSIKVHDAENISAIGTNAKRISGM